MKYDMRHLGMRAILLLNVLMMTLGTFAQKVTVKGPTSVAVGQQFQLQYIINTTDVKSFHIGNIPEAFEVVYGPSTSTQQSFSMVNGRTSQSASVTYTYVLSANKNGTFVIPAAYAVIGGHKVTSQALRISVSGKGNARQNTHGQNSASRVDRAGSRISGNDLFIRVTANKKQVYEQEPILLTYKVYTQVELTQLEGKMPDLNGFHTQEIQLPQQKTFHVENINGKQYRCVTWSQYVMFPQMSGQLEIPSITFKGIVVQENPNVDPFEAFFNGGSGYVEVKKEIKAPGVTIQVNPLPSKPVGYSSGVGNFSISSSVDKKTVKASDPIKLRVVVSGTGNTKLIKMPEIQLPNDFDKYDPKITDNTKLTADGLAGSMVYDYLIVPRNKGKYTIPAIELIYFDTKTKTYKTSRTSAIEINVEKGDGSGSMADYTSVNNNDISDLIVGDGVRERPSDTFFGSVNSILLNVVILVSFIALLIVFRKRAAAMADLTTLKVKKASGVATKRLKKAQKLMAENKETLFYEEVLRALWGYISDKLNIPVEKLSRENILENLAHSQVDEASANKFIEAVDECEFARYAPKSDTEGIRKMMADTYKKASEAIIEIEESVKKHKTSKKTLSLFIMVIMCLGCALNVAAKNEKAMADEAYRSGDYQKAIKLYGQELKAGESAALYHNLANCYYRTDNIPMAILNYGRAYKYAPMNAKIQHSIDIAISKTQDRLPMKYDIFFVQWFKGLQSVMTIDSWAYFALVSLILSLLLFLIFLFNENVIIKRLSFYCSIVLFLAFLCGNIFAWQRKKSLTSHDTAVVMVKETKMKTSPSDNATDEGLIHEGTMMVIEDRDIKGWFAVSLSDGRKGWIQVKDVEEI